MLKIVKKNYGDSHINLSLWYDVYTNMATSVDFSEWVTEELNQRGWHQAELVRRSGLSVGHVSRIVTGQRLPGKDAIQGIARAFKMPVEEVMRRAGLLPPPANASVDDRRSLADLVKKIEKLNAADRQIIADMVNRMAGE